MQIIRSLFEQERFIEALYYGTLQCKESCNAELHLYLGLACCAAIKPVAQYQRIFSEPVANNDIRLNSSDFIVTGNTTIVYEGFFHLIEAKRKDKDISINESIIEIVNKILIDLESYLEQDFHAYVFDTNFSVRTAGFAAYFILKKLINDADNIDPKIKRMEKYALELIEEVENTQAGDAEFYNNWIT